MEKFTVPCVAAIIEKITNNEKYILIQTRQKEDGAETNGMLELPDGKIREYENIFEALRREVKEETGLSITKILGEDNQISNFIKGNEVISYTPYCITQNLSGAKHFFMWSWGRIINWNKWESEYSLDKNWRFKKNFKK